MTIHEHHMAAGAQFCIGPHFGQKLRIDLQILVTSANESDLPQVQGLAADIDVGDGGVIEPKPGFKIVDNRHSAAAATLGGLAFPLDDRGARKGPVLNGQAKVHEDPGGNFQFVNIGAHLFEEAALENDFGIGGMHAIHQFLGMLQKSWIA
jgi:hypothetical protein